MGQFLLFEINHKELKGFHKVTRRKINIGNAFKRMNEKSCQINFMNLCVVLRAP